MRSQCKLLLKYLRHSCYSKMDTSRLFCTHKRFVSGEYALCKHFVVYRYFCVQAESENDIHNGISDTDEFNCRGKLGSELQENALRKFIENNKFADKEKWDEVKRDILRYKFGQIKEQNFGGMLMEICCALKNLSLGRSYINYSKNERLKLNLGTMCSYLKLCCFCKSECELDDINRIKSFSNKLLSKYPKLGVALREPVIIGLSITDQWETSLELFDKYEDHETPDMQVYNVTLNLLLDKERTDKFWEVLHKAIQNGIWVDDAYLHYLEKCNNDPEMFKKLLTVLDINDVTPSFHVADKLREVFIQFPPKENRKGMYTFMHNGKCNICNQCLNLVTISDKEFDALRAAFLDKVLIGRDIFTKSTPEELANFMGYVRSTAPYDVVVDSLNVLYMKNLRHPTKNSVRLPDYHLVEAVVNHFLDINKKVFIVGRHHMKNLREIFKRHLNKNVLVYLTSNSSSDDPFMLYATMYSGINTFFISRDLMRNQKYKLGDVKLMSTFKRWQLCRQYKVRYVNGDQVFFQDPLVYDMSIQQSKNEDCWHVPYIPEGMADTDSYKMHQHWLCLRTL